MKTVFVSSTFRDMQAERDLLKSKVQPMLNDLARQYGESISFSDLRWGVDTSNMSEEEQNKQVLSVCLDEIDRSRPFMIVLLGERYGFMPGPNMIKQEAVKRPALNLPDLDISVTQLEIEYGALSTKESLEHTYFYFRELSEDGLPAGFKETDPAYVKRLNELKERIKHLAGDHVRFYKAKWDGEKVTDLDEFAEAVKNDLENEFLPVWQKQSKLNIIEKTKAVQDSYIAEKCLSFKPEKERKGKSFFSDLVMLYRIYSHMVFRDNLPYLKYRKGFKPKGLASWFDASRIMPRFSAVLAGNIAQHEIVVHGHKYPALVLKGDKGSGRTMRMIHVCGILKRAGFHVIEIYAGSTSLFSSSKGILLYTLYRIEEIMGKSHKYIKDDTTTTSFLSENINMDEVLDYTKELVTEFSKTPRLYKRGRIAIAIDGIENLKNDEYKSRMAFVTEYVTDQVRVLLSADNSVDIPPMEKTFEFTNIKEDEILSIIDGALAYHGKQFGKEVKDALIKKEYSSNPLYLSLAVNRLDLMDADDFRQISETGDDIEAINKHLISLINSFPDDLESMSLVLLKAAADKISPSVFKAAEYIAISRNGLRADDLINILSAEGFSISQLEFVQFVNFMNDLFIVREDGSYDFMHSCIRNALLSNIEDKDRYQLNISQYLKSLPDDDVIRRGEYFWHALNSKSYVDAFEFISKMTEQGNSIDVYAQDFVQWAKNADDKAINIFFDMVHIIEDKNITKNLFKFIVYHCINAFEYKRADEATLDLIGRIILFLYKQAEDYDDEFKDILKDLYIKLGQRNTETPNRNVLKKSYDYLINALEMSSKTEDKIKCFGGLLEISYTTDDADIRARSIEFADNLKKIIDESQLDDDLKAKGCLSLGKYLCSTQVFSNYEKAYPYFDIAEAIYKGYNDKKSISTNDRYNYIDLCLSYADLIFAYRNKDYIGSSENYYKKALELASFTRDRYKDVRGRTAYAESYARKAVFDYFCSAQKFSLHAYLAQGNSQSAIYDSGIEAVRLEQDMQTEKSVFLNYWISLRLGYARFEYNQYNLAVSDFERAENTLNRIADVVPYYDRLKCEIMREKAWAEYQSANSETINKALDDLLESCHFAEKLSESNLLEDKILNAKCLYYHSNVAYNTRPESPNLEKNLRNAVANLLYCRDVMKEAMEHYDTPSSCIEDARIHMMLGHVYSKLGTEQDLERAQNHYKQVKHLYELLKKDNAGSFANEFLGIDLYIRKDKKKV